MMPSLRFGHLVREHGFLPHRQAVFIDAHFAAIRPEGLGQDHLIRLSRLRDHQVRDAHRLAFDVLPPRDAHDGIRLVDLAVGALGEHHSLVAGHAGQGNQGITHTALLLVNVHCRNFAGASAAPGLP